MERWLWDLTELPLKVHPAFNWLHVPNSWIFWTNDLGTKVIVPQETQKCMGAAV